MAVCLLVRCLGRIPHLSMRGNYVLSSSALGGGGQGSSSLICLFSEIADCCDKNENLVPLMASTILSLLHCLASALR